MENNNNSSAVCKLHTEIFWKDRCSNQYKCKLGGCSNQYPCKREILRADCGCTKAVSIENKEEVDLKELTFTYSSMISTALEIQKEEFPSSAITENELTRGLLDGQRHPDFPHVIAVEWFHVPKLSQHGRGDIVFANFPFPPNLQEELFTPEFAGLIFKVLIVEVKGIEGQNKGVKRRKVEEQLFASMSAWRKQRPKDEIWGCIYSNENVNWWNDLQSYDKIRVHHPLTLELVPRGAWGKNYRPSMPLALWRAILQYYKQKTKNRCEVCSWNETNVSEKKLVLHQRWITSKRRGKADLIFLGFQLLCWSCHDCKHFGWSQIEGRGVDAIFHMMEINNWSPTEVEIHLETAAQKERHEAFDGSVVINWNVVYDSFNSHPVVREWMLQHPDYPIRFGSMCLLRNPPYNVNPPNVSNR